MSRKLILSRPVAFLDLETTGVEVSTARIVEIAVVKVCPDGETITRTRRLDPLVQIPPEATAIHGITDADVDDLPTFKQVAASLADFLADCDFGGFNIIRYDLPVLCWEFHRAEQAFSIQGRRVIDAQRVFHKRERRGLAEAVKFYLDRDHEGAHGSQADALAAKEVVEGQLTKYSDLPSDVAALAEFCDWNPNVDLSGWSELTEGGYVLKRGKYAGRLVSDVYNSDRRYYVWLTTKCDGILPATLNAWRAQVEPQESRS